MMGRHQRAGKLAPSRAGARVNPTRIAKKTRYHAQQQRVTQTRVVASSRSTKEAVLSTKLAMPTATRIRTMTAKRVIPSQTPAHGRFVLSMTNAAIIQTMPALIPTHATGPVSAWRTMSCATMRIFAMESKHVILLTDARPGCRSCALTTNSSATALNRATRSKDACRRAILVPVRTRHGTKRKTDAIRSAHRAARGRSVAQTAAVDRAAHARLLPPVTLVRDSVRPA